VTCMVVALATEPTIRDPGGSAGAVPRRTGAADAPSAAGAEVLSATAHAHDTAQAATSAVNLEDGGSTLSARLAGRASHGRNSAAAITNQSLECSTVPLPSSAASSSASK
jgi:hypothetical protein